MAASTHRSTHYNAKQYSEESIHTYHARRSLALCGLCCVSHLERAKNWLRHDTPRSAHGAPTSLTHTHSPLLPLVRDKEYTHVLLLTAEFSSELGQRESSSGAPVERHGYKLCQVSLSLVLVSFVKTKARL